MWCEPREWAGRTLSRCARKWSLQSLRIRVPALRISTLKATVGRLKMSHATGDLLADRRALIGFLIQVNEPDLSHTHTHPLLLLLLLLLFFSFLRVVCVERGLVCCLWCGSLCRKWMRALSCVVLCCAECDRCWLVVWCRATGSMVGECVFRWGWKGRRIGC